MDMDGIRYLGGRWEEAEPPREGCDLVVLEGFRWRYGMVEVVEIETGSQIGEGSSARSGQGSGQGPMEVHPGTLDALRGGWLIPMPAQGEEVRADASDIPMEEAEEQPGPNGKSLPEMEEGALVPEIIPTEDRDEELVKLPEHIRMAVEMKYPQVRGYMDGPRPRWQVETMVQLTNERIQAVADAQGTRLATMRARLEADRFQKMLAEVSRKEGDVLEQCLGKVVGAQEDGRKMGEEQQGRQEALIDAQNLCVKQDMQGWADQIKKERKKVELYSTREEKSRARLLMRSKEPWLQRRQGMKSERVEKWWNLGGNCEGRGSMAGRSQKVGGILMCA